MDSKWLEYNLKELHAQAYQWTRQCCGFDDEKAKDVLQIVYLKIVEGKAKYNKQSAFKTWLFSIIRFTAIDYLKSQTEFVELDEQPMVQMEVSNSEMDYERLIELLPERQKEVMLMVFYHEHTLEQAAEVMGVGLGTARTHYDRGKKKLKELITKSRNYEIQ